MPWFKVDDSFESHPKVKSIPRARRVKAIGLWTLAGSWSARQLTDGFVPNYMLTELASTKREAQTLVEVGLWLDAEGGYVFKDWHDWQPTKAKVEAERDAAKERMRLARERKRGNVRANDSVSPPNGSGEVRSTPGSVTPTRPDPTRPDPEEETVEADAPTPPTTSLAVVNDNRPDVDRICDHLAEQIESRGSKRPAVTARWRNEGRLLIDRDGHDEHEIHSAIRWLFLSDHRDAQFWRTNVRSMPKLREEFDRLRELAQRPASPASGRAQQQSDFLARAMARAEERERGMG